MPTITLPESAKLSQDMLVSGVIENVITVNRFFQALPFASIEGNALAYNRENTLGDAEFTGVGSNITGKNPATFTQVTSSLTSIIGDAEVNGLIQATRSNIQDQEAIQIASKAKSVGRKFQNTLINGDGTSDSFEGLLSLVSSNQTVSADDGSGNGDTLSFDYLDELIDKVTDKDGAVDYLMMNARSLRSYFALLRSLGGAGIGDVVNLADGQEIPGYRNIPIFRNDYIPTDQATGTSAATTTIFAGTLDDGSLSHGISGLTAADSAGLNVQDVGASETKDETITRVKWYCGLALFSEKGLAALSGVRN